MPVIWRKVEDQEERLRRLTVEQQRLLEFDFANLPHDLDRAEREGIRRNVAAFGAFVDIGVHQDGLVHVSAMAKTFVKDPREIVKPGDIVRVKVLDVDKPRKRIALTLRLDDEVGRNPGGAGTAAARADSAPRLPQPHRKEPTPGGALADALRRAGLAADEKGTNRTKPR
jgi:uncharacterized protein